MDPFVHLPVFNVVVCTVCQHAVLPNISLPRLHCNRVFFTYKKCLCVGLAKKPGYTVTGFQG